MRAVIGFLLILLAVFFLVIGLSSVVHVVVTIATRVFVRTWDWVTRKS
jgi:hypothetical protein